MQTEGKMHKSSIQDKKFNSQTPEEPRQPSNQSDSGYGQLQLQNLKNNPDLIPENQLFKGCNCKKSKCMKMYCECFYIGSRCSETCKCIGCLNGPLANNPNQTNNQINVSSNMNNSKQNFEELIENRKNKILSKGCNCKKSGCQKKYCECFNIGAICNALCKCQECKNIIADNFDENISDEISSSEKKEQKIRQKQYENKVKQLKSNQRQQQIVQKIQKNVEFSQKLKNLLSNVEPSYQQSLLEYLHYMLS